VLQSLAQSASDCVTPTLTQYTSNQHNCNINKGTVYAATNTHWLHDRL